MTYFTSLALVILILAAATDGIVGHFSRRV